MKHSTRLWVLLLLIVMVFTGCGQRKEPESESVLQQEPESSEDAEDTSNVKIEVSDKPSKPAGDLVDEGVYEITSYLRIEGYTVSGMYLLDNEQLLVTLLDSQALLTTQIYDIYTGKVLEEKSWDHWYSEFTVFETEDGSRGYSAVDADNQTALAYWNGEWRTVEIPETMRQVQFYGNGKMLGLSRSDLYRDGAVIHLPDEYVYYDFIKTEPDGTTLLQAYNSDTGHYFYYLVDVRGRVLDADIGTEWIQRYNEWYVKGYDKEYTLYHEDNMRSATKYTLDDREEVIWDAAGDTLLTVAIDNELRMYSIQNGTLQHKYAAGRNLYIASLSSDGTKAVAGYQGEVYYYLDIEAGEKEKRSRLWPGWVDTENDVGAKEASMEEKYPVEIYTGEDAVYPFQDFAVMPLTNTDAIMEALEQIDKVLGAFPEGFLEELLTTDISKMRIYVTGEIISDPAKGSTSDPIAFAYPDYTLETQFIVLDGREPDAIVKNLSHELMHAIDTCITEKSYYGYAGFWQWDSYQPYGFWYNYSYQNADGEDYSDIQYTRDDDENEIYFLDAYSKTFAIEDRARIFEYLMAAAIDGESLEEYKGTPLMKKAEYLCVVIRSAFICVNEETVWEKGLVE